MGGTTSSGPKTGSYAVQRYQPARPGLGKMPTTGTGLPVPVKQPSLVAPKPSPFIPSVPKTVSNPQPQPMPSLPYGGPIALPGGNVNGQLPSAPVQNPLSNLGPIALPGGNVNGQLPTTVPLMGGMGTFTNVPMPSVGSSGPIQVPINGNPDGVFPSSPVQGAPDQIDPATGFPYGMQSSVKQQPDGDVNGQFPSSFNPNLGNPGGNYDNQILRQFDANAQLLPKMTFGGNTNSHQKSF